MTTQKSCFNLPRVLPFIRNTLYRYRGILLFYFVMCFLFLPVQYAFSIYRYSTQYAGSQWEAWYEILNRNLAGASQIYNAFSAVFFTALMLIMPLVLSVTVYSYMHNRRSVDVYHSLPLTRQELFLGRSAAAAVILWVPLIINFGLTAALCAFVPASSPWAVLSDLLFWMAGTLAMFAVTSFVTTQVGTSSDHVMFAIVLNVSLSGVCVMLSTLASAFLYGYEMSEGFAELVYRLCPASLMVGRMMITDGSYLVNNNIAAAVWFVVSLILLAVSAHLYARRHSEQAEVLGNMGPLQVYVRTVGTLVAGICFGWVLAAVFDLESEAAMLCCIAAGSMLAYYIGDVILTRSVRRLRVTLPAALATVAVVCVLCGGVVFDYFGYESRVPALEKIASVTLERTNLRYSGQSYYKTGRGRKITLTDPAAIEIIASAHKNQAQSEENRNENGSLRMTYRLKNGAEVRRAYYGLSTEAAKLLGTLETNDEVLRQTAAVFRMQARDLREISFENMIGTHVQEISLSEHDKEALLEALCADLLAQPQSELDNGTRAVGVLNLTVPYDYGEAVMERTLESGQKEDLVTYAYLLPESFERTLSILEKTSASGALENNLDEIGTIALWLYEGHYYTDERYLVARSADIPQTSWEYREEGSRKIYPTCEITKEEYASLSGLTCYLPNLSKDSQEMVAVLYYRDSPQDGAEACGWEMVRLSDLPQELQRRVVSAYETYYDTKYSPEENTLEGQKYVYTEAAAAVN